ncbi:uncharacterized protein [Lepeophtheirus salmonis]|uniref:uncharacterized protein n=1 Tax=Lepeophtheirus salmonis TaxID=72036 RepID=UPI001AE5F832|nr:uncharacterized protein LOC121114604 [Lepeophtheirus salmonis]
MELDLKSSSVEIVGALVSIKSRVSIVPPNKKLLELLIKSNIVSQLVSLLSRPNSKIVDLSLSILATLLLQETPRNQIRSCKGIRIVLGIIGTIGEESILSRACRALANMGMNPKNVDVMFDEGVLPLLLKTLSDVSCPRTKQVIVRAIRILGSSRSKYKQKIVQGQGIVSVSALLDTKDKELLRAVTRCLAHFTHGGDLSTATQVQSDSGRGFRRLAELVRSKDPKISESALSCLINLSHVESVRPNLGNAGTISVLVDRIPESKNTTVFYQGVIALCLFCRESVNRRKLRDSGGLAFFVEVLRMDDKCNLHNRILQSLLQFNYDTLSLNILQDKGLIPTLLKLLNKDEAVTSFKHSCEAEISKSEIEKFDSDPLSLSIHETIEMETSGTEIPKNKTEIENESEEDGNEQELDVNASRIYNNLVSNTNMGGEEPAKFSNKRSNITFRVDSPSYQEVQKEFQRFLKVRDNVIDLEDSIPGSLCQSPDRSPWSTPSSRGGYSPESSCSGYSPLHDPMEVSYSTPKYSSYGPISDTEDEDSNPATMPIVISSPEQPTKVYSPIETFSETEEENDEDGISEDPVPSTSSASPPPPKKRRTSFSSSLALNIPKVQSIFDLPTSPIKFSTTPEDSSFSFPNKEDKYSSQNQFIFQILSRLSQAEKPHDNIVSLETTTTLLRHLFTMPEDPGESRVARILLRLSRNLYAFMSFVYQRQLPYLRRAFDSFCTLEDSPCIRCNKIKGFLNSFSTNVSLLAETGYAEGEMCHHLLRGSVHEKRSIAISTPFVARPRKLLRNILINHEGLEIIFDVLETCSDSLSNDFFSHSVMSLNVLASHLGVINPNLTMAKMRRNLKNICKFKPGVGVIFVLDDGSEVHADRSVLTSSSQVFEAMLVGAFVESGKEKIKLPLTSKHALECLIHRLYGCDWKCPQFKENMRVEVLLELLMVSDKYLMEDFSIEVSREIIRRCYHGGNDIIDIYKGSLVVDYPVRGLGIDSLSKSTIQYILVGTMSNIKRVEIFSTILFSELKNDFIDDVSKMITSKLNEVR